MASIVYASLENAPSFRRAVTSVCKEEKYLANSKGFSEEETLEFVTNIVKNNEAQYYAIIDDNVVGWCDVIRRPQEFHSHVGVLGMGIVKEFRRQGIGTKLIYRTIDHARENGIEKVELEVYDSNVVARKLYERLGFSVEGVKKEGKKFRNEYEDIIMMGLKTNSLRTS